MDLSNIPANVQYAWPHPSKQFFYVASSNGGPGVVGDKHLANYFRIDPASGALQPHGQPQSLPSWPIHISLEVLRRLCCKLEDPGALKVFGFNKGVITNLGSIAPGIGLGFGPRYLDFHPTQALGLCFDRAPEQALCLQTPT
jgi:6-phosphogluconolactonase (cycloisomerase 2 family)